MVDMNKFLIILLLSVYITKAENCQYLGQELIPNGSFDKGFSGFYTEYVFLNSPPMSNTGSCAVTGDPASYFNGWMTFPDKSPSNNNLMFLADASINPKLVLIGTNVDVARNIYYKFSLWVARVNNSGPPNIKVVINDIDQISKKITVLRGEWVNIEFEWNSGNVDKANIEIFNTDPTQYGNDFVIDEISFKPCVITDLSPPQISGIEDCYIINGKIIDSSSTNTGIKSYESPEKSKVNCTVSFGELTKNARSINFISKLDNYRIDGSFVIEAIDSNNQLNSRKFDIKGFTVGVDGGNINDYYNFNEIVQPDVTKCFKILLRNYGKFVQSVKSITLKNPSVFFSTTTFPITINPGGVVSVEICFKSKDTKIFVDSLFLVSDCDDLLNIANFKISTIQDKYPQISASEDCYKINGNIYDSTVTDSGIKTYESPDKYKVNCKVVFGELSENKKSISFESQLENIFKDGSFVVTGSDYNDQVTTEDFEIKGFTVGVKIEDSPSDIIKVFDTVLIDRSFCYKVKLFNYGKFNQNVNKIFLKNSDNFQLVNKAPFIIFPGQTEEIDICFRGAVESGYYDSLIIENECNTTKIVADFNLVVLPDKFPPRYITNTDTCAKEAVIYVNDSLNWDSGIKDITVLESHNCDINVNLLSNKFAIVSIKYIDFDKDLFYKILITDSSGNQTQLTDTIETHELKILGIDSGNSGFKNFGDIMFRNIARDSVMVYNLSSKSIVIDNLYLKQNVNFSIPPSQFPFRILPYDSVNIIICFYPDKFHHQSYEDTLLIESYCIKHEVILKAVGKSIEDTINSKCRIDLVLHSSENSDDDTIIEEVYPNPSNNNINIVFNNSTHSRITIELFNINGIPEVNLLNTYLKAGKYEVNVQLNNYDSGVYFIKLTTDKKSDLRSIMIIK